MSAIKNLKTRFKLIKFKNTLSGKRVLNNFLNSTYSYRLFAVYSGLLSLFCVNFIILTGYIGFYSLLNEILISFLPFIFLINVFVSLIFIVRLIMKHLSKQKTDNKGNIPLKYLIIIFLLIASIGHFVVINQVINLNFNSNQNSSRNSIRVAFWNRLYTNNNLNVSDITKYNADILVLGEYANSTLTTPITAALSKVYKYYKVTVCLNFDCTKGDDGFGVFSKLRISKAEVNLSLDFPMLEIQVSTNDKKLDILAIHPLSPGGVNRYNWRNTQYKSLKNFLAKNQYDIVLGDFNLSPYSRFYFEFIKNLDYQNFGLSQGFYPSWRFYWFPVAISTIDHIFISKQSKWQGVNFESHFIWTSDHNLILIDIV